MDEEDNEIQGTQAAEPETPRRRPKKIVIPKRDPSVVIPGRQVIFTTPDKTTCAECPCFPKEDPYRKPKKLNPCQKSPFTLYELAAVVVDRLPLPAALSWGEEEVANWMAEACGLPQYQACILDNHVNGMRLLMYEDPSQLPHINIREFHHILIIVRNIRELYSLEFVRFARSVGLPPRYPLTHCTGFKSRTGPTWGIRVNWTKCDILRWMKILDPEPLYRDHWDLVWYQRPDFPKVLFGSKVRRGTCQSIPHYRPPSPEVCREYLVPRKFRLLTCIPDEAQYIWMERQSDVLPLESPKKEKKRVRIVPKETHLHPKRVSLTGLKGKDLVLARRKMVKPKFLQ